MKRRRSSCSMPAWRPASTRSTPRMCIRSGRRGHQGGESETVIGNWLKRRGKRDDVIIATKVGAQMGSGDKGLSRAWIMKEADASLKRLQTDVIDLYQAHRDDPDTPQEETAQAFADLVKQGKVRALGRVQLHRRAAEVGAGGQQGARAAALRIAAAAVQPGGAPGVRGGTGITVPGRRARRDQLLCAGRGISHRQVPIGGGPAQEPARRRREEIPQRSAVSAY